MDFFIKHIDIALSNKADQVKSKSLYQETDYLSLNPQSSQKAKKSCLKNFKKNYGTVSKFLFLSNILAKKVEISVI